MMTRIGEDRGLRSASARRLAAALAEAVATCSMTKPTHRFRWPWQKLPTKLEWKPDASDAVNPMFDIQAEGFCPVRTDLVWFSQEAPLFANLAGDRWPLVMS